ncbi:glycosyltransferase [Psychroserpens damuponensis]|uniref:glycosyltransferase n=1 Tax=Psychroserpens damuponensis TaxID=943936 RepID=UPI0005915956|nr:glycosyltransferase [Psychroserpens damuponensis]
MITLVFIITFLYLVLIGSFVYGFDKVNDFKLEDISPKTKFSVIIPFRNEADHLPALLASISKLNYPKSLYEIILVDDDSEDNSIETISSSSLQELNVDISVVKNVRKTSSPKKDAITTAIRQSKYPWIVTTDADCILSKYWLDGFDNYIQHHNPKLLIAPVTFTGVDTFFKRFQLLDILSLQGVTIGSFGIHKPFLCNGANLAYQKDIFNTVKGFEGNSHISSGDDIFLLEKIIKRDKNSVHYVKNDAIVVSTTPELTFNNLKSQRVRWAAKTSNYNSIFSKITAIIVVLMNGLLVCFPLLYVAQLLTLKTLVYTCAIKFLIDFLLLFKSARFFNQAQYLSSYILSCFIYPFFSIYVTFISIFSSYKWKGRSFKK